MAAPTVRVVKRDDVGTGWYGELLHQDSAQGTYSAKPGVDLRGFLFAAIHPQTYGLGEREVHCLRNAKVDLVISTLIRRIRRLFDEVSLEPAFFGPLKGLSMSQVVLIEKVLFDNSGDLHLVFNNLRGGRIPWRIRGTAPEATGAGFPLTRQYSRDLDEYREEYRSNSPVLAWDSKLTADGT